MSIADEFLALEESKRNGTLRFYGCWFGAPYDNYHSSISAKWDGDVFLITFDEGEILEIVRPSSLSLSNNNKVAIQKADKVRWTWHLYGCQKTPENKVVLEYGWKNGQLYEHSTPNRFPAGQPNENSPAVEFF